ncbi:MAG: App1 family protein [Leeuwenhoekiella sp.]
MKLDLKLYRGYVNDTQLTVSGHLFQSWAPDKYKLDRKGIRHAFSIFHMFRIEPLINKEVELRFKGVEITTRTMEDGYFRFSIPFKQELPSGWHNYQVIYNDGGIGITDTQELLKPFPGKLGVISDIDDTFLISHSNSLFKKLYVMLSKNINKRKPYENVVRHYQFLSSAGRMGNEGFNSFFYVSSSEWNLYAFIAEFAQLHDLPKAVIKLKKIKTRLLDFVKSGRGDHDHKFVKIKDIINFYPNTTYVLLGDDSQQDPYIYERICKLFPLNIRAVYIRQTGRGERKKVEQALHTISLMRVAVCYFKHSEQAIAHSREIDLIDPEPVIPQEDL